MYVIWREVGVVKQWLVGIDQERGNTTWTQNREEATQFTKEEVLSVSKDVERLTFFMFDVELIK